MPRYVERLTSILIMLFSAIWMATETIRLVGARVYVSDKDFFPFFKGFFFELNVH